MSLNSASSSSELVMVLAYVGAGMMVFRSLVSASFPLTKAAHSSRTDSGSLDISSETRSLHGSLSELWTCGLDSVGFERGGHNCVGTNQGVGYPSEVRHVAPPRDLGLGVRVAGARVIPRLQDPLHEAALGQQLVHRQRDERGLQKGPLKDFFLRGQAAGSRTGTWAASPPRLPWFPSSSGGDRSATPARG